MRRAWAKGDHVEIFLFASWHLGKVVDITKDVGEGDLLSCLWEGNDGFSTAMTKVQRFSTNVRPVCRARMYSPGIVAVYG